MEKPGYGIPGVLMATAASIFQLSRAFLPFLLPALAHCTILVRLAASHG